MKKNYPVTGNEVPYSDEANILSTTNLKGAITYFNDDFLNISGFEEYELINKNHNVVRHPEMPQAAFEDLWNTAKSGNSWMGIVKNRCKNGDHYWVDAFVTPIRKNGEIVEYQSVRVKPDSSAVKRASEVYKSLNEGKTPRSIKPPRLGLQGKSVIASILAMGITTGIVAAFFELEPAALMAIFLIALISSIVVNFLVLSPVRHAIKQARKVTNNAIARYIYTGRKDDVGVLMLAMKMLSSETTGVVGRITDSSKKLSSCAQELIDKIKTSHRGIEVQFAETDQVATAVTEMAASIQEVSSNAQLTAEASSRGMDEAIKGKSVVNETMETISSLADKLDAANQQMSKVEDDSNNISTITNVISAISEQTNLLALNAAIEAARAGEMGKGFAVVAEEVRTLASRTNEATQQIQGMIEQLQEGAKIASVAMSESQVLATESVQQARHAVDSLNDIQSSVTQINDMSTQIAAAVEEQSAVSEEINRSIVAIRDVSQKNMDDSNHSTNSSEAMLSMAKGLEDLAEEFMMKRIENNFASS
jgi:aerotaxis receptor